MVPPACVVVPVGRLVCIRITYLTSINELAVVQATATPFPADVAYYFSNSPVLANDKPGSLKPNLPKDDDGIRNVTRLPS